MEKDLGPKARRILYWVPLFWPNVGGIEIMAAKSLPLLKLRDYEFMVITSQGERPLAEEDEYEGSKIYRFRILASFGRNDIKEIARIQRRLSEIISAYQPELIHVNFGGPIVYFHDKTYKDPSIPVLVTLHANIENLDCGPNTIFGKVLRSADWTVGVSQTIIDLAVQKVPELQGKSSVIYNGTDLSSLAPTPLNFEPPTILCIGRLVEQKGFDLAIRAFAKVASAFPEARLLLAGDGDQRAALEQLAKELQLVERVQFLGTVDAARIPQLINSSTMVVMPSRGSILQEAFPLVAIEAAQMGRPVIASGLGEHSESVLDGQTGILVKEDVDAFAKAMLYLIEHPEIASNMGQAAQKRALELFQVSTFVDSYDAIYAKLIEQAH